MGVPAASQCTRSITERLRQPSGSLDLFEFAVGEKRDETAVGRPEGIGRAIGTAQQLARERVQRAHPEASPGFRPRDESYTTTVRRNGESVASNRLLLRYGKRKAHRFHLRRGAAEISNGEGQRCQQRSYCDRSDNPCQPRIAE